MNYNLPDGLYCMYLRKSRADRDSQLYDEQEILARHEMILKETAEKMPSVFMEKHTLNELKSFGKNYLSGEKNEKDKIEKMLL